MKQRSRIILKKIESKFCVIIRSQFISKLWPITNNDLSPLTPHIEPHKFILKFPSHLSRTSRHIRQHNSFKFISHIYREHSFLEESQAELFQ